MNTLTNRLKLTGWLRRPPRALSIPEAKAKQAAARANARRAADGANRPAPGFWGRALAKLRQIWANHRSPPVRANNDSPPVRANNDSPLQPGQPGEVRHG